MEVTTIGIDLAKNVFAVCAADGSGRVLTVPIAAWWSCFATDSTAYGLFDLSRRPAACASVRDASKRVDAHLEGSEDD
jgi:hypothetical protein